MTVAPAGLTEQNSVGLGEGSLPSSQFVLWAVTPEWPIFYRSPTHNMVALGVGKGLHTDTCMSHIRPTQVQPRNQKSHGQREPHPIPELSLVGSD